MNGKITISDPAVQQQLQARADIIRSVGKPGAFSSEGISRDLSRYYALLQRTLRSVDLTSGEAHLICDALNGCWMREVGGIGHPSAKSVLELEVSDAMRLNGLAEKWEVSPGPLMAKLTIMSELQAVAVLDAVERFWQMEQASPGDVGLCP